MQTFFRGAVKRAGAIAEFTVIKSLKRSYHKEDFKREKAETS